MYVLRLAAVGNCGEVNNEAMGQDSPCKAAQQFWSKRIIGYRIGPEILCL